MQIRRINFWGGAGTGKSTMAARIFARLKSENLVEKGVELIPEFIKVFAYEGLLPKSFGQLNTFTGQLFSEDRVLQHVDLIVSDSPVLMAVAYARYYDFVGWEELLSLARKFEKQFPSINFFLPRKFSYQTVGRFQNETEAVEIENLIKNLVTQELPESQLHFIGDAEEIFEKIRMSLPS